MTLQQAKDDMQKAITCLRLEIPPENGIVDDIQQRFNNLIAQSPVIKNDEDLQIAVASFLKANPNAGASYAFCEGVKYASQSPVLKDMDVEFMNPQEVVKLAEDYTLMHFGKRQVDKYIHDAFIAGYQANHQSIPKDV